jgi:hypothetical protein
MDEEFPTHEEPSAIPDNRDTLIAIYEQENEQLRRKLAYLYMRQKPLLAQIRDAITRLVTRLAHGDLETILRVMIYATLIESVLVLVVRIFRKR